MGTPIHLDQHPLLRIPLPPPPMPRRPPRLRTPQPCRQQDPPHRRPTDRYPLPLLQHLRQMRMVKPCISPPRQLHYPLSNLLPQNMKGRSPSIPMGNPRSSLLPISCQYPPPLPLGYPKNLYRFSYLHPLLLNLIHDQQPLLLFPIQGQSLFHPPILTFSLTN